MTPAQYLLHLQPAHAGRPQEIERLRHALNSVFEGLAVLASLGHQYSLTPGPPAPLPLWPRMLFNLHIAPNGRVVRDEQELRELGPGWYDTLEDAQHQNGKETQMRSRGNVPRPATVPMVLERQPLEHERIELRLAQHSAARNAAKEAL